MDKNPKISLFNFPSLDKLPDCNQSLQMINTLNVIPPQPSLDNLDMPNLPPSEDSLAERLSPLPTATPSSKKKKPGCTCKKTYCLKMYCECFSQGKQCGQECGCLNCKNAPGFQELIQNAKQGIKQGGSRSCKLSQKRCTCRKTRCIKRYCECYNAGVSCGQHCKCQGCQNKHQSEKQQSQPQDPQKEANIPIQFPSIVGYRSIDDLQKFYN